MRVSQHFPVFDLCPLILTFVTISSLFNLLIKIHLQDSRPAGGALTNPLTSWSGSGRCLCLYLVEVMKRAVTAADRVQGRGFFSVSKTAAETETETTTTETSRLRPRCCRSAVSRSVGEERGRFSPRLMMQHCCGLNSCEGDGTVGWTRCQHR